MFTPAFAQAATGAPNGADLLLQLVPFALIAFAYYYFAIRPRRKPAKQHTDLGYFNMDSSATRYLAAAAYTDRVFRDTAIRITDDEFRASAPEFGFNSELVLQHCRIAKRRKVLRDAALCVPLVVLTATGVFRHIAEAPGQFSEIVEHYKLPLIGSWALAALILFIYYILTDYITLARQFSVNRFLSPEKIKTIPLKERRNVVVYGGFSPFVGSGFELGGWSFTVNLEQGTHNSTERREPQSFEINELYDALTNGFERLGIDNLTISDRIYVDGKSIRKDTRFLQNHLSRPVTTVSQKPS